jgi:O-antigen/teichoic acid export membrane protein
VTPSRLRAQAVAGVGWSATGHVGHQLIQFGISVLLARLLVPKDFGVVGMLMVFIGFAMLFGEFGLGAALIQQRDITEVQLSSTFWLNLAVGVVLMLLFIGLAPGIARFYRIDQLLPLGRVMALGFPVAALAVVPGALLTRKMAFRSLAFIQVTSTLIAGTGAVVVALNGAGAWTLVVHWLLLATSTSVLTFRAAGWRPRLVYSATEMRGLLAFGANLFGFNFVNYWARNADNLLIGKFLGSAPLGLYDRAYRLMLLPIGQIAAVLGRVMFPALSSIQDDHERIRHIYLRLVAAIGLVAFPLMAGLLVVAEPFVLVVFGDKWAGVVPALQVLCVVGILQTLMNPVGWIYQSQGRTDLLFRWGLAASTVLVLAIVIGVSFGTVEAVAWSYLVANAALLTPCIWMAARIIELRTKDVLRAAAGSLGCALVMASLVLTFDIGVAQAWESAPRLVVDVALGVLIYSVLLITAKPRGAVDVVGLLLQRREQHQGEEPHLASTPADLGRTQSDLP